MYSILYTYVNVENVGPRILGERESLHIKYVSVKFMYLWEALLLTKQA